MSGYLPSGCDFCKLFNRLRDAFNAAKFQHRIEGGEVVEFHCHAAMAAAKTPGEINEDRLAGIEMPEAEIIRAW